MQDIRCICHNISLDEIINISKQLNYISLEDLIKAKICCTKCRLCAPYIEDLLKIMKKGV